MEFGPGDPTLFSRHATQYARTRARDEEQAERWAEGLGIISGGLLLRSASAHVLGHHGVVTDLQFGVIHRPETS